MGYEGSPVKAPPNTRRGMMLPTPQQISHSSTDGKPVASGSGGTTEYLEYSGKKGNCGNEQLPGKKRRYKVEIKRRGSRIFEIFSTKEKTDHLVASRNRWLEKEGNVVALQERWQSEWQGVNCEGTMAKAPQCPERRTRTSLPQQSSSSTREEESQWSSVEDRRKWCVALENAEITRKN